MNFLKTLPIMPEQASDRAAWYDGLFFTITGLTVFFTLFVFALILFLATRYRRGSDADRRSPVYHSTPLEVLMMGVPLVLGLGIFAWASIQFINYRRPVKDAMEVFVVGKQWMWHLQHMNGIRENNELHIPVDTPVKMTMISQDVIHAMYLPDFRAQYHVVPGRYTDLNFTPTKTGRFRMLCAMHCGTQHSEMVGFVYVLSKRDYAKWVENNGNRYAQQAMTMAEAGKKVWNEKGCGNCHNAVDNMRAPTVEGIYKTTRKFTDGTSAVADPDYLRESIMMPWMRLTAGYQSTMPAYKGQLTEEQVLSLVEYIKDLGVASGSGPKQPYVPAPLPTEPMPSGPENATDRASRSASAGVMQANEGAANQ